MSYVVESERLWVHGWDAATGRELWKHAASPGAAAWSLVEVSAHLTKAGGKTWAVFPTEATPGHDHITAVDIHTGETIYSQVQIQVSGSPRTCSSATGVCVTGVLADTTNSDDYVFDPVTGALAEDAGALPEDQGTTLPEGATNFGNGFYARTDDGCSGGAECDILGFVADGGVVWERRRTDVMGEPSTVRSWRPVGDNDASVVVFGASGPFDGTSDEPRVYRLTDARVVALSKTDGSSVWSYDGGCITSVDEEANELVLTVATSGTVTWSGPQGMRSEEIADVEADMIRVRMEDGQKLWETPIGELSYRTGAHSRTFALPSGYRFIDADAGYAAVDLKTGEVTPVPADGTLPCVEGHSSTLKHHVGAGQFGRDDDDKFNGGDLLSPCTTALELAAEWSVAAVTLSEASTDDPTTVALPTREGIAVFTLPE
ncbi:MAG: hypothetical protein LBS56_06130 [Propionibacteriaceae bacterium]|nr:hypothetical protein [Propionibacteriaceae bacterium]